MARRGGIDTMYGWNASHAVVPHPWARTSSATRKETRSINAQTPDAELDAFDIDVASRDSASSSSTLRLILPQDKAMGKNERRPVTAVSSAEAGSKHDTMMTTTTTTSTGTGTGTVTGMNHSPYRYQGGRRYLRDPALAYPLPVDLTELHRQLMRMLLCIRLHGMPFRNDVFKDRPPKRVLEVACGGAFWSSACHDYFRNRGFDKVSFTGVDLAPLPPDLKAAGVNWKFIQHDIRNKLSIFPDASFDFVFVKDALFARQDGIVPRELPLAEVLRILEPGGVIEIWESDYVFRTLVPNPTLTKDLTEDEVELAQDCAVYPIDPSTSFAQTRNTALAQYNSWTESALEKRHLPAAPCAYITWMFTAHADELKEYGSRRIAVPFSEMRWEKECNKEPLNDFQLSLRQSALQNCLDFMDALEPLLKEESGKRQDEWDRWKAGLVTDLVNGHGTTDGECLELGAWWATKY